MSRGAQAVCVLVAACTLGGCNQPLVCVRVHLPPPDNKAPTSVPDPTPVTGASSPPPEDPRPESPACPGAVSTVASPEKPKRQISLAECVALALENGRTATFYDRPGSDRQTSVSGLTRDTPPSGATDSLRVFAYDPAILATEIEESLAKFDAIFQTSLVWNHVDEPSRNLVGTLAGQELLGTLNRADYVTFSSGFVKPLPTGGVAGITFREDYEKDLFPPGAPVLNPAYRSAIDITFEQPLLQGAGVLINQLRDTLPGGIRTPVPVGGRVPGILLTRIAFNESQLEFERHVHELLFVVEQAYWDLYCAYWDLYSRDSGLHLAQDLWQRAKARYEAGGLGIQDVAQIEVEYQLFRSQRLQALGDGFAGRLGVLEAERRLRYVVGLPAEDGSRLIPCDAPVTVPLEPDWKAAVNDALACRPELAQVREEIRAAQLLIRQAEDLTLPDLRLISRYSPNGLGGNLGNSLSNLGNLSHQDWEMGLQLQVPIGTRAGHAELTRTRLQLSQRCTFLRDQEAKAILSLQRSFRSLVQAREEMQTRRAEREAAALQLRALYERFKAGDRNTDILVRTQEMWADALREEQVAVCNYNVALVDFERQKGTIMQHDNVTIAAGPLPRCAQERASAHIREFERAIKVKDPTPGCILQDCPHPLSVPAPLAPLPLPPAEQPETPVPPPAKMSLEPAENELEAGPTLTLEH